MRLSLLKSAEAPDTEADLGLQEFTYAIYVHTEQWHESELIPLAWDLNDPVIAVPGKPGADALKINSTGAALDAVKKSEDGKDLIVRFHEMHGGRALLRADFIVPVSGIAECNLMEEPIEAYAKGGIKKELRPFEIVTYRIKI